MFVRHLHYQHYQGIRLMTLPEMTFVVETNIEIYIFPVNI